LPALVTNAGNFLKTAPLLCTGEATAAEDIGTPESALARVKAVG
jgi:hypothetical protein